MQIKRTARFLSQTLTVGVAAAIVLLLLLPQLERNGPVVEVKQASPQPSATAAAHGALGSGPVSYAEAVAQAAPAVVNIHSTKQVTRRASPLLDDPMFRDLFGDLFSSPRRGLETSLGSGVIISAQGYILTNQHVISESEQIRVALRDGRMSKATVVGTDPETDLAVLKINLEELPSVTIGQSDELQVGDVVLAIGNPFGVGQTVTMGIVSATGRNNLDIATFEDFIQTDAAINPGNSGGALVNAYGHLVGINTAIYSRTGGSQGIGFAVPVSLAKGVMEQIIEQGRVSRGWIGIEMQQLTPGLAESFGMKHARGVLVAGVQRGGPAREAGVRPGDIITAINDAAIEDAQDVLIAITGMSPGDTAQLSILRETSTERLMVRVAERPTRFTERPARR